MAIAENESVLISGDGAVTTLFISRPESLNALNPDVLQSIILAVQKIRRNDALRAVIITGDGPKAFVAGADIRSMADLGPRAIADYVELGQRAMRTLECLEVPVIAAVNGYALGGGLELALACDIILASENAKLGQPEVNLGIIPGFGGTQRLIQRCGIGAARRLTYTGELISSEEAKLIGLVDKIYPADELYAGAQEMAKSIAEKAPLAVQEAKRVIRESQEVPFLGGLRREVEGFLGLFDTRDREEGMRAFLEKRKPTFTGK